MNAGGNIELTNQQDEYQERKKKLAKKGRFKSRCALCHLKYNRKSGFTFHHIYYERDIDKSPDQFTTAKNKSQNDYAYKSHILDEVERNPSKFRLLCSKHHHAITISIRFKNGNWRRFVELVNESRKKQ